MPSRSRAPRLVEAALAYHDRTKHQPGRFARSPGFMDWDTQPDPSRRFDGAPLEPLDLMPISDEPRYEAGLVEGAVPPAPVDRRALSQLLGDSLGLSAWKQAGGARWALRTTPSSGNLHPTEGYVLTGEAAWHYQPHLHALERRRDLEGLPEDAVLVGLTDIYWRESWKYGERAFRYCQLDMGHAIAALAVAAGGLGWRARLVEGATDDDISALLGLDEQASLGPEAEHPGALLAVGPPISEPDLSALQRGQVHGRPRALSADHHDWPVIDEVHAATLKSGPARYRGGGIPGDTIAVGDAPLGLRRIVHQRRSAVAMDGRTGITAEDFFQVLRRLLPRAGQVPFAALPWRPAVHLALFVHRVEGLAPGLYLLVRDPDQVDALREALDPSFAWSRSSDLPLYLLQEGDTRRAAAGLSCGQDIASDGAFAVAMLAEFRPRLDRHGAWFYRRLHWEAGAIGQVLYLEAEATGVRGTGIGCFFDDACHRLLGLADHTWQVLYHFTVGGPVEDRRLQTLPPYGHL